MLAFSIGFICLTALIVSPAQSQSTDCVTPKGESGTCIAIHMCEHLINLIKDDIALVQRSRCAFLAGYVYPRVCCPISSLTAPVRTLAPTTAPGQEETDEEEEEEEQDLQVIEEHPNLSLLPEDCGHATTNKIIGGNETALDEYPWTALLEYQRDGGTRSFGCGGVLISNRYVLTAAHCTTKHVRKYKMRLVSIRLGEHNTATEIDCAPPSFTVCADPPVDYDVEAEIPHPKYTANKQNHNDIALLRLRTEVPDIHTDYIRAICIPIDNELLANNFFGKSLTVAGWGKTGDVAGFNSPVKLKVHLPVVDNAECARQYAAHNIRVTANQMCAGGRRDMDACGGDSGGPLMSPVFLTRDSQVHYHIIGIVSYGADCKIVDNSSNDPWIPGVYTRVASYRNWILDQLHP